MPGSDLMRWYSAITCSTARCWRLYSWMRLTITSNMEDGSTTTPVVSRTSSASATLFWCRAACHCSRKPASSAYGSSARSCARSEIQPSPIASDTSRVRRGLDSASQRRGVTPLVMLVNFSGHIS